MVRRKHHRGSAEGDDLYGSAPCNVYTHSIPIQSSWEMRQERDVQTEAECPVE